MRKFTQGAGSNFDRFTVESALAMGVLIATSALVWGWRHRSGSVDMPLHYAVVAYIAEHWHWPSLAVSYMNGMNQYPPLSHTAAAVAGVLCGSPILGLHLVSTASAIIVLAILFLLLRFHDAQATIVATAAVATLLSVFENTRAFLSQEIVSNFFFPQLFGEMCVFVLVWLRSRFALTLFAEITTALVATFVLGWVYPIAAVQLGAVALVWRALQTTSNWYADGRLSLRDVIALAGLAVGVALAIALHPRFATVATLANNEGWIMVRIPGVLVIPATGLLLGLTAVLGIIVIRGTVIPGKFGLRAPDAFVALCGGIAGASLAQEAAFYLFGLGSRYAVYKHIFAVSTLLVCAAVVCAIHIARFRLPSTGSSSSERLAHLAFAPAALVVLLANAPPWHGEWMGPMVRAEAFYRSALAQHPDAKGHAVVLADGKIDQFGFSMGIIHLSMEDTLKLLYENNATPQQRAQLIEQTPVAYVFVRASDVANPACIVASDPRREFAMIRYGCQVPGAGNTPL
jgi:hypothetical protein